MAMLQLHLLSLGRGERVTAAQVSLRSHTSLSSAEGSAVAALSRRLPHLQVSQDPLFPPEAFHLCYINLFISFFFLCDFSH